MKKNLTEIVFVLDASGSMFPLTADTVGGFNSMLAEQRQESGEAVVSTVLFNHTSTVIHDRVPIAEVPELTAEQYRANGSTALLDAVGAAIHHIGTIHKYTRPEDVPEKTVFIITTDGMENASRRYTQREVKQMIGRQKEKYGWEFIFLGANIDAAETAQSIGIAEERAVNYAASTEGTQMLFRGVGRAVHAARTQPNMGSKWREELDRANQKK